MSIATHPAVAEYLAGIQAALSDLPAAEVEEIVEDIGQHLSEVAEELGEDVSVEALSARLGTPEQYASELRAAAGYPPPDGAPSEAEPSWFLARFAFWSLVFTMVVAFLAGLYFVDSTAETLGPALVLSIPLFLALIVIFTDRIPVSAVTQLPEYQAAARAGRRAMEALPDNVASYLRSLRPAWWLMRVVVLGAVILLSLDRHRTSQFLLATAAALILLLLGGKARSDARWRWLVGPANLMAVGMVISLVLAAWSAMTGVPDFRYVGYEPQSGIIHNGRFVSNIFVFGPDGKPLTETYLYDQEGRPLSVPVYACPGVSYGSPRNKFPLPDAGRDEFGRCEEVLTIPFSVVIPPSAVPTTSLPTTPAPASTAVPTTTVAPTTTTVPSVTPTK